jgi:hypothetical protein
MSAAEAWGLFHFWTGQEFAQFLLGSIALWIAASFLLWKSWLGRRGITFDLYGFLPIAVFGALDAQRDHERNSSLFWIAMIAVFISLAFWEILAPKKVVRNASNVKTSSPPRTASSARISYLLAALVWFGALRWFGQFLHHSLPLWVSLAMAVPPLVCILCVFILGNDRQNEDSMTSRAHAQDNQGGRA